MAIADIKTAIALEVSYSTEAGITRNTTLSDIAADLQSLIDYVRGMELNSQLTAGDIILAEDLKLGIRPRILKLQPLECYYIFFDQDIKFYQAVLSTLTTLESRAAR